ncbi:hypothetical protein [Kitasatospora sp. NPDC001547]
MRMPSVVADRSASPVWPCTPELAMATSTARPTALPTCRMIRHENLGT